MRRRNNVLQSATPVTKEDLPQKMVSFEQAVKAYFLHKRSLNLSPRTIEFYQEALRHFERTFQKQNMAIDLSKMTARNIKEHYIGYMLDSGLASYTINNRIRACKTFFRFLYEEHIVKQPIFDQLRLIVAEKKMIQTLTKEQVLDLLEQPDRKSFTGLRDYTIMMVLLETGMRISECIALELGDVFLKEREIIIRMGKGRKARRVPIQKTCANVLQQYIAERGELDSKALFVNVEDERIGKRTIQENIQEYGKAAGIEDVRVSPHTFRHTMAKFYIMNGGDIFTLQKILGHSTLDMVRHYVELFSTDIRDQHQKYSPVENMNFGKRSQ
ncbi:tyrosine-type recombinase/integrase [Cohnella fermenti]|uniref:Integrase n=1 Tax=Cohnella fermenti TaxID=2565925 RepID=A0A4S4BJ17_9BACL|nr:tyrosine-type recombinase/integrase [Cohnella fermenti]THF74409.1 integrase [Cohnella fermenti]